MSGLTIRAPSLQDTDTFVAAVQASRDLHHPWVTPPSTPQAFRDYVEGSGSRRLSYLIHADDTLVGVVNASEIVRGTFQSCYLGYYAFSDKAGQGLMTPGMRLVLTRLFHTEGLHRAEANIQPDNTRSIDLVRRLGFHKEGYSPAYLQINGEWRDHERWALLAHDHQPS